MVTDPDKMLGLAYASSAMRPVLKAVLLLDEALGQVVAGTREPMIGRIRLAWWRERLEALSQGEAAPDEPVLKMVQAQLSSQQIAALGALVDGWEVLLDDPLERAALQSYAMARATGISGVMPSEPLTRALRFWALADFGFRCSEPRIAAEAFALASEIAPEISLPALPRPFRVLVGLALHDVHQKAPRRHAEGPRRLARALRFAVLPPR
jgi:phytoene synthase